MKRNEFLSTLGIGIAAACTGCLASCGKGGDASPTPNPPGGGGGGGTVSFTTDLSSELISVGQSKVNSGVILVRIAAGNTATSFTAVQVACTHEGTSINYNSAQGSFVCPNHGSRFSNAGAVLNGPATTNLKTYNIAVSGNTLTVTS